MEADNTGLYLYAVTNRMPAGEAPRCAGVEPAAPVQIFEFNNLGAAVSQVLMRDFDPEEVRRRLAAGETRWVEEQALAHARVIEELRQRGPVAPIRFGTIFKDERRLMEALAPHAGGIRELLDRLAGMVELGLKVFSREDTLRHAIEKQDADIRDVLEMLVDLPAGTAYLRRKNLDKLVRDRADDYLDSWIQRVHETMKGISVQCEILRDSGAYAQRPEVLVLNEAHLIPTTRGEEFNEEIERLASELAPWGLRFDVSGPWPPYHFARLPMAVESI